MAKLTRVTGKIFGETASPSGVDPEIGQFGSAKAGTYNGTSDIATIQSLSAWSNGWIDAVTPSNQYPPLPERTGVDKVLSYQECYLLQQGIPEWDSATDYYENCFCAYGNTIYISLQDNNTNNEPDVSPQYWEVYGAVTDYANQDISNLTEFGNARLQFAPFAINAGTVTNGENDTLRFPEGSGTIAYITGTVEQFGHHVSNKGYTVNRTFDSPKVLTDVTATYNLYPDYNSTCTTTLRAILNDDTSLQIGTYTHSGRANYSHTATYTFNTPTTVKALQIYIGISGNGSAGVKNISFTEQISVSAGDSIICDPCTITTCDGRTKQDLGSAVYDVTTTADGNYYVFKDYETGELSLYSNLTVSKIEPSTPSTNDLWLDISTIPANLKEYDGSWNIDNDLVYIGNGTISSNVVTDVSSREFNDSGYLVERQYCSLPDYPAGISITTSQHINLSYNALLIWYKTSATASTTNIVVYLGIDTSSTVRICTGGQTNNAGGGYYSVALPLCKNEDYYIALTGTAFACKIYPLKGGK